jgi:hypothetical protein
VRIVESERLEVAAGRTTGGEPPPPRPPNRGRGRIAIAVVLLVLSGGWLLFTRSAPRTTVAPIAPSSTSAKVDASGVHVDVWHLRLPEALARYRTESGATIAARSGAPACARGQPDERAWSRPESPQVVSGRYRCRMESGHAAMWWIDEHGLLAHAVARNANLSALFAWWRAQSGG